MEQFNSIPTHGRFDSVVDAITNNFQLTYEMLSRLETATTKNLGTFPSLPAITSDIVAGTNVTVLADNTFTLYTAYPTEQGLTWVQVGTFVPTNSYAVITDEEMASACVLT